MDEYAMQVFMKMLDEEIYSVEFEIEFIKTILFTQR